MDVDQLRETVPEVCNRLDELERERARLAQVTFAYRVVSKSKFAQLRSLRAEAGALFRGNRRKLKLVRTIQPLLADADANHASGLPLSPKVAGKVADVLERVIDELTLARAGYHDAKDALESLRTRIAPVEPYSLWMQKYGTREIDIERARELVPILRRRPVFSVIMPTYNTPERYLRAAIDSVRAQVYPDWELCIADDASSDPNVRRILEEYAGLDSRIKLTFRPKNGHISRATNSAIEIATGEFLAFLDHDDIITADALFECALLVNREPDVDMIYSDEDKIDDTGTLTKPYFKPKWSPDSYLSRNYTGHFSAYRRSIVEELGGLRPEFDGSQDYDLGLRFTERTSHIHHIPKILYHWRIHGASAASSTDVKPYARDAAERAVAEALERRREPGPASVVRAWPGTFIVRYAIHDRKKVSVIIPTRNHGDDIERCLKSIFAKTTYGDFEVLVIDNGSDEKSSLETFAKWSKRERRVRVLRYDIPFNFSKITNFAVENTDGHYLLLLNNDTEVISADWMEGMVEQAQRPSIGAVGALLLYPDGTVQHGGVIVGLGGVACHSHKDFPGDAAGYFAVLSTVNNFSAVTAACLMVRRSAYNEVGGFDERLAVAFNDVDFCLKLREAGYRNVYLPHVKLYHFESKSRGRDETPEQVRRFDGEIELMKQRWKTDTAIDPYYSPNLTHDREDFGIRTR